MTKECSMGICPGPDDCAAIGMMNDAPSIEDLDNTFRVVATKCPKANTEELITVYKENKDKLLGTKNNLVSAIVKLS